MKIGANFATDLTNFLQWMYHTDFDIDCHKRNQSCFFSDCFTQTARIDVTFSIHRYPSHFKTFIFQLPTAFQDTFMFSYTSYNVFSGVILCFCYTLNCEIVGFRGPGSENNLSAFSSDYFCNLGPRHLYSIACLPPVIILRVWITKP